MEWYKRWFGEEYLLVYEHRNMEEAEREVAFLDRTLKLKKNDLILDLCCGPGRHDYPLVRKGYRVIGLDYSFPMLCIARNALYPGTGYPLYIRADARSIPLRNGIFDAVLNLFTSFGYFEDRENQEFLASIARLLKNGGKYYIDYLNPPQLLAGLSAETIREKNGLTVVEKRHHDANRKRVEKTIIIQSGNFEQEYQESVRLYQLDEMIDMLNAAGLTVEEIFGSTGGEKYSESSERMIIHGIKSYSKLN
jgi:SAM-dependent methyltransferase